MNINLNFGDLLMDKDNDGKWQIGWITIPKLTSSGIYSNMCQSEWTDSKLKLIKVMLTIEEASLYRKKYLNYRSQIII